jgi:hypothetical protein
MTTTIPAPSYLAESAVAVQSSTSARHHNCLVGLITWDNGLATGSMAQVIHDVDVTPSTGPDLASPADGTSASRWNAWQSRGDALASAGRMRALLALSVALTCALLFYAWLR